MEGTEERKRTSWEDVEGWKGRERKRRGQNGEGEHDRWRCSQSFLGSLRSLQHVWITKHSCSYSILQQLIEIERDKKAENIQILDFKQRTDKNKVFLGSSSVHVITFQDITLLTCCTLSYKPLLKPILKTGLAITHYEPSCHISMFSAFDMLSRLLMTVIRH